MKKTLFILFILVSMLFPGCENELPYMNKPQVPQLLMNAFLEAGKKENGVSLRMIDTDKQQADCVSNGSIVVYVNGQKTETAEVEKVYGSFDDPNCTLKTSFRPGDRIRFEATAEDGQYQAGCEVEIPFPIEETIRVDTFRTQLRGGSSMMDCMRYKITRKIITVLLSKKIHTGFLRKQVSNTVPFPLIPKLSTRRILC